MALGGSLLPAWHRPRPRLRVVHRGCRGERRRLLFRRDDADARRRARAFQDCDADERTPAHRKPFAGGYVFAVQCASNNENFVETLIFSEHEDGSGGWRLQFPRPTQRGGGMADTISNIRWFPKPREIGEIFVDRESPPICRSEARWRLEGAKRKPKLVVLARDKRL